MADVFRLAGKRPLSVEDAAGQIAYAYPAATVRLYDHGQLSPRDAVVPDDIGRLVVFAARVTYQGAVELLECPPPGDWWDLPADAALIDEEAALGGSTYLAMEQLYGHYCSGPSGRARRPAWASKLLHRKWPDLFPILDSRVLSFYSDAARTTARRHGHRGSLNWTAIRCDLLSNGAIRRGREHPSGSAFLSLRHTLATLAAKADEKTRVHIDRVLALTDLRLHDMIVWSAARDKSL